MATHTLCCNLLGVTVISDVDFVWWRRVLV